MWIINGTIAPLILMYVWILVCRNNPSAFLDSQIIAYYLLGIVVLRLTQSWSMEDLGQKIKDGFMSIMIFRGISLVDRFPISLYPSFVRLIFTFIIPITIIFTLPAIIDSLVKNLV